MYCDFHEWSPWLINRWNTVRTVRIDVTIMEISWSQKWWWITLSLCGPDMPGSEQDEVGLLTVILLWGEGWRTKSGPKIRSEYMTCFHIAYSLYHILGALSYIFTLGGGFLELLFYVLFMFTTEMSCLMGCDRRSSCFCFLFCSLILCRSRVQNCTK
jgi:hypothetical protein